MQNVWITFISTTQKFSKEMFLENEWGFNIRKMELDRFRIRAFRKNLCEQKIFPRAAAETVIANKSIKSEKDLQTFTTIKLINSYYNI